MSYWKRVNELFCSIFQLAKRFEKRDEAREEEEEAKETGRLADSETITNMVLMCHVPSQVPLRIWTDKQDVKYESLRSTRLKCKDS